ncbi:MAG: hypothetical protein P8Y06_02605, partial [Patescibacteria group bacterium]
MKYLKLGKSRNLLWFFIISFLATPAFYVQTLFLVYVSVLFIFVLEAVIRGGEGVFLRSLRLALTLFVANAFWLLPVIYFSFTNTQIIQQSHINSIATVETQIMNEASGSLKDVASLKGFWFNYMDLAANNKFDYLYRVWIDYFNSHLYIGFYSYLLFGIGVLGLITALFQKKNKFRFSGLLVFLLVYFMLASTNPPFGEVFKVLSGKIPLFNEIFRSVFTKWSLIGAFSYSLGLALFIFTIGGFLKRLIIPMLLTLVLFSLMILPVKPIFEGKLISDTMQVKIPNEYFRTFEFFNDV